MRAFATPTATGELQVDMYYSVDTTCSIFSPARVIVETSAVTVVSALGQFLASSCPDLGEAFFPRPREEWGIVETIVGAFGCRFDLENLRLFFFFPFGPFRI